MCQDKIWSSFLCVLACSSVIKQRLHIYFPEFGSLKYKTLFNGLIIPRTFYELNSFTVSQPFLNILYCSLSNNQELSSTFTANHFVPLISRKMKRSSLSETQQSYKKITKKSSFNPFSKKSMFDYFKTTNQTPTSISTSTASIVTSSSSVTTFATSSILTTPAFSLSNSVRTTSSSTSTKLSMSSKPSISSSKPSTSTKVSLSLKQITETTTVSISNSSIQSTSSSIDINCPPLFLPKSYTKFYISNKSAKGNPTVKTINPSVSSNIPNYIGTTINTSDSSDVSTFFTRADKLSDTELNDLVKNVFVPERSFQFPKYTGKRRFRYEWLVKYDWLRYSPICDGGFCLPCVLFFNKAPIRLQKQQNLVSKAVVASSESTSIFNRHQSARDGIHAFCLNAFQVFFNRFSGRSVSVDTLVNNLRFQKVVKNRAVLEPIVDTVILCGHLGLSLRGHRDDSKYYPESGCYSESPGIGNFIEMINYAIRRGDKVLEEHYKNHSKNASYMSKTSQNELVSCCGDIITEQIVSDIKFRSNKNHYYFTILADEALDSSGKEQLSLVLRFLDSSSNIREEFVGFVHLKDGLKGENIANAIKEKVKDLGLNIMNCRGQGYDGAGSVAGYKSGCSAFILRDNRKALFTHCFSHRLNLAVSKSFKITSVNNMMETVHKISDFFRFSEQRQLSFEKNVQLYCPASTKSKLRDPCRTRWVERIKDLELFVELFQPLWVTLEEMKSNLSKEYNKKTQTDAFSFFKAIDDFDFVVNLIITYHVLQLSLLVTELLQSKKNDIADGTHMIQSLIKRVSMIRHQVDRYHSSWYDKCISVTKRLNIPEKKPRTNKRQIFRDNHPSTSVCDFYKVSLTIQLLDTLQQHLESRFSDNALVAYTGLYLIPSKLNTSRTDKKSLYELTKSFFEFYKSDLPFYERVEAELGLWQKYWSGLQDCPDNISSTLQSIDFTGFQNIKEALHILATLPITSCECERSFSGMKRLKNFLRSTMNQNRLNGLALLNFHQDKVPDKDKVIQRFAGLRERRLELDL